MLETLNILEGYNLAKMGNRSADAIHVTAEAFRRAFLIVPNYWAIPISARFRRSVD